MGASEKPMKLTRYEARTLGNGTDYALTEEEDGPLCRDFDVEKLEAKLEPLLAVVEALNKYVASQKHRRLHMRKVFELMPAALEAMEVEK